MKCSHCEHDKAHPDHSGELHRLSRIAGQVEGIRKMIEENRYCPDILTQIKAVRSALHALEGSVLEAHLKSCVVEAFASNDEQEKQKKIAELKEIFKRFDA